MSLAARINRLKDHQKSDPSKNIILLMKYFHWNLEDMKKLSIPAFMTLLTTVNEIEKDAKENREMKGKKKHGGKRK